MFRMDWTALNQRLLQKLMGSNSRHFFFIFSNLAATFYLKPFIILKISNQWLIILFHFHSDFSLDICTRMPFDHRSLLCSLPDIRPITTTPHESGPRVCDQGSASYYYRMYMIIWDTCCLQAVIIVETNPSRVSGGTIYSLTTDIALIVTSDIQIYVEKNCMSEKKPKFYLQKSDIQDSCQAF